MESQSSVGAQTFATYLSKQTGTAFFIDTRFTFFAIMTNRIFSIQSCPVTTE